MRDFGWQAPVEEAVERSGLRPRRLGGGGDGALRLGDRRAQRADRRGKRLAEEGEQSGREEAQSEPLHDPGRLREEKKRRGDGRGDRRHDRRVAQQRARGKAAPFLRQFALECTDPRHEPAVLGLVDAGLRHERLEPLRDIARVGVAKFAPPQV